MQLYSIRLVPIPRIPHFKALVISPFGIDLELEYEPVEGRFKCNKVTQLDMHSRDHAKAEAIR